MLLVDAWVFLMLRRIMLPSSLSLSPFFPSFVLFTFTQTAAASLRERQDLIDKDSNTEQQANLTSSTMPI